MFAENPLFTTPPQKAQLWRYMDFAKFVSLLSTQTLFFARADRLSDAWEGAMTRPNLNARQFDIRNIFELNQEQQAGLTRRLSNLFECMKKHTYISCWHENEQESAAMWKLYVTGGQGIAVQSTFKSLTQALGTSYPFHAGLVRYKDYNADTFPEGNTLAPFVHKRASFAHEREVRAVIQDNRGEDEAPAAEFGIQVPADLNVDAVQSLLNQFGLKREVRRSSLDEDPVY